MTDNETINDAEKVKKAFGEQTLYVQPTENTKEWLEKVTSE